MSSNAGITTTAHHPHALRNITPAQAIPLSQTGVSAGYPFPAQDYDAESLDLNEHLIRDRVSTFTLRVAGNSMIDANISDGDEVIVDRGLTPQHHDAVIDREFTVKHFIDAGTHGYLYPKNPDYPDIPLGHV